MGLFSRKTTDVESDKYHVTATMIGTTSGAGVGGSAGEKSVVKVIRSRFYGKKGKEREAPISYIPQNLSVAQTLSIGNTATAHAPVTSSPLAGSSKGLRSKRAPAAAPTTATLPLKATTGKLSISIEHEIPLPPTPPPKRRVVASGSGRDSDSMPPPMTPVKDRGEGRFMLAGVGANSSSSSSMVSSPSRVGGSDAVTTTLAQRLNELAVAHADGLLNDDEYRILRQNLFERFASASEVPSEAPIVPAARSRPNPTVNGPQTPDRAASRPISNFQVEVPRPPSSQSRYSITSNVASIFRRTSTSAPPKDTTDAASLWSQQSSQSPSRWKLGRVLSRKSSNSSLQTTASRKDQADAISITSRLERPGTSFSRPETPHRRKHATPPSAFPGAMKHHETRFPNNNIYNLFDEDHLSSAAEIRQEIHAVEVEVKRLMDAFNGLEVTTLSKAQRSRGYSVTRSDAGRPSNVGSVVESKWSTEGKSAPRYNLAESDAGSIRSANTTGTGLSKSASSGRAALRAKTSVTTSLALSTTSSRPASLRRKNSSSSVHSHGHPKQPTPVVPLPAMPNLAGINGANNSSVSLTRSAHTMAAVPEDDARSAADTVTTTVRLEDEVSDGDGVEDIRRRREEVQQRYDARLDYLRAKLKSAELHEKLLRR
ncbi:hypothetical protein NP233_g11963 [Leucocoprinus birnbaumii]|uniref:Uncharacterized protein n=1 Tax=Leucocoprinus birnbaumii TaxID=56174 RepID=A0AAD5VFV0_9AGAR|nr:hypothetical protein NP233_g11963 [Leucocoprinus birnbaumii]